MCKACYIHVPFCKDICGYCDFTRCRYHFKLAEKWLIRIREEIIHTLQDCELKTLYIGGGTPSALSYEQLKTLLELLQPYLTTVEEFTIEANVDSFDEEKIKLCAMHGVNRVSLGVQSLQDEILQYIHRHHTSHDVKQCIHMLHKNGIHNISIDLIYGLPKQTMDMWKLDLSQIVHSFDIQHISLYALTIEEHSQFGRDAIRPIDSDMEADMYEYAVTFLNDNKFQRYEISNFAKNGYSSKHNQMYWQYEDFYGIGCGASGKEGHVRYDNTKNLETYFQKGPQPTRIELSKADEMFEMIMMSLRLCIGLSLQHFHERFDCDVYDVFKDAIAKHVQLGNICIEDGYMYASDKVYAILNDILIDFLP